MRKSLKGLSVAGLGAICFACGASQHFDFLRTTAAVTETYYNGTEQEAKMALINFIKQSEENLVTLETQRGLDFKRTLGMAWLRLASIYRNENDEAKFQDAINHATAYFDQDSALASDPRYKNNKTGSLLELLKRTEGPNGPSWRAAPKGGAEPKVSAEPGGVRPAPLR